MADNSMYYGDSETPNLYKCSVLRKVKQQYIDKTVGVEGTDPINSIISLKYEMEHNGTIHNIGWIHFLFIIGFLYKSTYINQAEVRTGEVYV